MEKRLPNSKKIAILRANALGDFIFVLPALQALRESYPKAEIVLLGKSWHKEFLATRPSPVDRVEVVPQSKGVNGNNFVEDDTPALEQFFKKMREEKFDIAIQLHGGGRYSNPFIKRLDALFTVGLQTPEAEALDISLPYIYYQSEILRYLEVVASIGAVTSHISPVVQVTPQDLQEAARYVSDKPFIVLHPGVTDDRRRWSPKKFAQIGDFFVKKNFDVFITGTETEIVDDVLSAMKYPAHNLANKLSLSGLTGVLFRAELVIANDTGPLHLAEAIGTPTVGIYWCANLINGGPISREYHRNVVSWLVNCPLCGMNCAAGYPWEDQSHCNHILSFVDNISVEEVKNEAVSLVEHLRKTNLAANHLSKPMQVQSLLYSDDSAV